MIAKLSAEFTRENQIRILEHYLATEEVKNRPNGMQRWFDTLIEQCYAAGEIELAISAWALMICRIEEIHHLAGTLMLSQLGQIHASGMLEEILNSSANRKIFTLCNRCGTSRRPCDQDFCDACKAFLDTASAAYMRYFPYAALDRETMRLVEGGADESKAS